MADNRTQGGPADPTAEQQGGGITHRSPLAPGSHGAAAEAHREAAILQLVNLQVLAGALEELLRVSPDDDQAFEYWAAQFVGTIPLAGHCVAMFRDTRECCGGRQ